MTSHYHHKDVLVCWKDVAPQSREDALHNVSATGVPLEEHSLREPHWNNSSIVLSGLSSPGSLPSLKNELSVDTGGQQEAH